MARVLRSSGKAVVIVGHESRVLGTPFNNARLIEEIARESGAFDVVLRQKRVFLNRFGRSIREDILSLVKRRYRSDHSLAERTGRRVALDALNRAFADVPDKNRIHLEAAIQNTHKISGTPIFNSGCYEAYQTRDHVMMVSESMES